MADISKFQSGGGLGISLEGTQNPQGKEKYSIFIVKSWRLLLIVTSLQDILFDLWKKVCDQQIRFWVKGSQKGYVLYMYACVIDSSYYSLVCLE